MPVLSYEVGAAFILEDRVSGPLAEIGRAFESLADLTATLQERFATLGEGAFSGLLAGVDRVETALTRMVEQTNAVAGSWDRAAAAAERYATAAGTGGAGGLGGGGGGRRPREDPTQPGGRNDRAYANAVNQDYDRVRSNEHRMADAENAARDRAANDGLIGPPDRPYWGEDDDWANANAEDRSRNQASNNERRGAEYENRDRDLAERQRADRRAAAAGFGGGVLHGMAPLIAGVAGFEAEKAAMEEQIAIKQALMGINITEDMPEYQTSYDRLRELAYTSTKGTKFSNVQAAKTLREALPVLAMEGKEALDTADKTFPIALRLGELSSHRGKGQIGSEAVAAEEFAHLEQNYDPVHMVHSLDQINAIAMKNDTSVRAQLNIMKYGLPTAMLAGIDPEKAAGEIGAAELRMGATSTAGTGYSQWLLGGMIFKGHVGAGQAKQHQQRARAAEHELENALRLEGGPDAARQHVTGVKTDAHDAALVRLGIFTSKGDLLAKTSEGKYDEDKVKELMAHYAATHSRTDTIETMEKAFQTRGSRFSEAYINPEMIEREKSQIATFKNAPSVEKELHGLAGTALQQFEQMLANIANTGNILATQTLPGLTAAFQGLNTVIVKFNDFLNAHSGIAEAGGYGAVGVAGLAAIGTLAKTASVLWRWTGKPVVSGVRGLFGAGGEVAAGGVGEEALTGAGLFGPAGLLAAGGLGAAAAGGYYGGKYLAGALPDSVSGASKAISDLKYRQEHGGMPSWAAPSALPGPRAAAAPATAGPVTVTVNLGGVTNNGVGDDSTFRRLVSRLQGALTDGIKSALEHATSAPAGTPQSAFSYPGGF